MDNRFSRRHNLILGGSGFIGTRLAQHLINQGEVVRIGDLRSSRAFPSLWSECDVRREETLADLVRDCGAIINLAAEHSDNVYPLTRYWETNVRGAENVCRAARRAQVKKIIFTSSVAVYGSHAEPVDESGPFAPFNEYGKTKLEAEGIYRTWVAEDPSRTLVIVRPTVVFGEGNRGNVYTLMNQIARNRFFMVGSGLNKKSMAYVGNVAAFLAHTLSSGPGTHIFNYIDGPDINTRDLVKYIRRHLHQGGRVPVLPRSAAVAMAAGFDVIARLSGRKLSISRVRVRKFCSNSQFRAERVALSGFVPPYSLSEGLQRTLEAEYPDNK